MSGGDRDFSNIFVSVERRKIPLSVTQRTTVRELKTKIENDIGHKSSYIKLSYGGIILSDDNAKLLDYNTYHNATIMVYIEQPTLYVTGIDGQVHAIKGPFDSEDFLITDLFVKLQEELKLDLSQYEVLFNNEPIEKVKQDGKNATLSDYNLKPHDNLYIVQSGSKFSATDRQVNLCFLVDCTSSMGSHITAVKNCVKTVADKMLETFKSCNISFAFVRYTDYDQPEKDRTTYINFTSDQSAFHKFVDAIKANGGNDTPEDVMGGLKVALNNLSWGDKTVCKVLIHIADSPCHGAQYHNFSDKYKSGDPAGITHEQMMGKIADYGIQYWFGYIDYEATSKMINVFNESLQKISGKRLLIRQIKATNPKEVEDAASRSVNESIYGAEHASQCRM